MRAYYGLPANGTRRDARTRSEAAIAEQLELDLSALQSRLQRAKGKLLAARSRRVAPQRDDKVLAAWNGLMISALATTGFALDEARYLERAEQAASFVLEHMRDPQGRLLRTFDGESARHAAYLEDYAFTIAGLLDLFEATSSPRWLRSALELQALLDQDYGDATGGYFRTSKAENLPHAREAHRRSRGAVRERGRAREPAAPGSAHRARTVP